MGEFDIAEVELWLLRYFQTGMADGSPFLSPEHRGRTPDRQLLCEQMKARFGGNILYELRAHPIFTLH